MPIHLISQDLADQFGAKCLDGSVPSYYYNFATDPALANRWVLAMHGGGWCYDLEDCVGRSKSSLGSSIVAAKEHPDLGVGGILSDDSDANPLFAGANRIYLWYCDGASFAGQAEDPADYNGTTLWFRGRNNLRAIVADLTANHGFGDAEEVLLSGCSAGGLATYLAADYFADELLPSGVTKYKAMPLSGMFMDLPNYNGTEVYGTTLRNVFEFQNMTSGVDAGCIAARKASGGDTSDCVFAQHTYPYITSDVLVVNSVYDEWQVQNELAGALYADAWGELTDAANQFGSGVASCMASHGVNGDCTSDVIGPVVAWGKSMVQAYNEAPTWTKSGNGAWLHSCMFHCAANGGAGWNTFRSGGGKGPLLNETFYDFWEETGAGPYNNLPCTRDPSTPTALCNPTCSL